MTDPADLEQLREDLAEARLRFQSLLDNCVDAIIVIDETGRILEFSAAAERTFGYAAEEVLGRNVSMLMPEPDRSRHHQYIRNYLRSGEARIIGVGREVIGQRKDGSTFPMDLSVGEMPEPEGHIRNFIGVIRDITTRRNIELQLRHALKMEALGQLTGGIAHDFNNLLAILQMDLEMLDELTRDSDEGQELVKEAQEVTRTGADLTRRLLAFSRKQPLSPSRLDINTQVLSITGLLRRTIGEAIRIDTIGASGLWPVSVDKAQLESAIVNLALNARDAMLDGGTLTIAARNVTIGADVSTGLPDLPPGDYVCLSVRDTGSGIPSDVIQHVFEPFFTTKTGGHGTGMGLSMVYGFVKQSGGDVAIASEPGRGTTVTLYFPRDVSGGAMEERPPALVARPRGSESILLVEDDPRLRDRTADALKRLGYRVTPAANAAEALALLQGDSQFAVLFTDIVMPGPINGVELARQARESHPMLKLLFMTGYAERTDLLSHFLVAGTQILTKPFTTEQLARTVRTVLSR